METQHMSAYHAPILSITDKKCIWQHVAMSHLLCMSLHLYKNTILEKLYSTTVNFAIIILS